MFAVEGVIITKVFEPRWRYSGSAVAFNLAQLRQSTLIFWLSCWSTRKQVIDFARVAREKTPKISFVVANMM
jgi:hypothetical protein